MYIRTWVSAIGEHLKCEREPNSRDRYAVVVVGVVTGHIHTYACK